MRRDLQYLTDILESARIALQHMSQKSLDEFKE